MPHDLSDKGGGRRWGSTRAPPGRAAVADARVVAGRHLCWRWHRRGEGSSSDEFFNGQPNRQVCVVKAPGFGGEQESQLTGPCYRYRGEVIIEELGMNLETQMLGTCKKVTVSKDDTVILDGDGDKEAIEERAEHIHSILI